MARLASQAVVSFLSQTPVFKGVPPEVLAKLALYVDQQTTPRGKPLLPPGAVVTTLGVLYTGRASLQIVDALSGAKTPLEEIYPGDVFGEVGLVLGTASPIAVTAEEDCESLVIQKAHFDKICAAVPDALQAIARQIGARFVKVSLVGSKRSATRADRTEADPVTATNLAVLPATGSTALPAGTIPFVEVSSYQVGPKILELVPTRVMLEQRLLPLEVKGRTLVVGMVNPRSIQAKDELRRGLHSMDPEIVAISSDDFTNSVARLKIDVRDQRGAAPGAPPASRVLRPTYASDVKKEGEKQVQVMIGDEVVQLLDRILGEAVERGASDIHIEPEAVGMRVRLRLQGMLVERKEMVPVSYAAPLAARIKVLSELDITERRMPQDGRIAATFGTREINFRVSTMPVSRGEKVVIRILDPGDVMRPLEHIFQERQLEHVQRAISATHGAIMMAGATGSGKSSTLYSLLNARKLARPDNNIVTVEDPIEFLVSGLSQSGLNPKTGLTYPQALRGLMRQDPDVIMVGELRDEATAGMMIEAALTGHLVLSTMHGSNIGAVFQRLEHFGIDTMRIGQAMNVVIVQKLARRLCTACVREDEVSPQLAEVLVMRKLLAKGAATRLPRAVGCEACNSSGYRGRVAAHEMLFFADEVKLALEGGMSQTDVLASAEKAGNFFSFAHNARLLMGKRAITPADALGLTD